MERLLSVIRGLVGPAVPVTASTPVISTGLIDSFAFAALIAELEVAFRITLDPAHVGADNFDTPAQMLHFIISRQ
jgi:acyl carrier protein